MHSQSTLPLHARDPDHCCRSLRFAPSRSGVRSLPPVTYPPSLTGCPDVPGTVRRHSTQSGRAAPESLACNSKPFLISSARFPCVRPTTCKPLHPRSSHRSPRSAAPPSTSPKAPPDPQYHFAKEMSVVAKPEAHEIPRCLRVPALQSSDLARFSSGSPDQDSLPSLQSPRTHPTYAPSSPGASPLRRSPGALDHRPRPNPSLPPPPGSA